MPHHADPDFATTLAHGVQLLHCFTIAEPALSNKELAQRTGLSKATISRLTYTLAARGLVVFDEHLRRYRLGSTALTIGYPLLASLRIRQVARARMKRLAEEIGGSVSLGMRDRTRMIYVETHRGHELNAWRPDIGGAVPMLSTAMGRGWLAHVAPPQRRNALRQLQEQEPAHFREHAASLQQAQEDLRRHGYCISRGDWYSDVHAVAVPVRVLQQGETVVFNCGVLTSRLAPRQLERHVGPKLVTLVRAVESELESSS
jgi:DNA-binding IclR family transcriptional regulator